MGAIPVVSGLNDHQLGALVVLALIFQVGMMVKLRSTGKDAKAAKDQTVSTGNGFAAHVLGKLDKLTESSDVLQRSMERMQGTQGEHREQLDFVKKYVQRVDKRQQDHMQYHVSQEKNNA